MDNPDARVNQASMVLQTIGLVDQEMRHVVKPEFMRWLWNDIVKMPPESFDTIFLTEPAPGPEDEEYNDEGYDDDEEF